MADKVNLGSGVIGVMFLAVAAVKFFTGGNAVVWIILGVLFGGISGLRALTGRGQS